MAAPTDTRPDRQPSRGGRPPIPGHGLRRWLIVAGAVAVIVVAAVLSLPRHDDGPRVIADRSFVAAANTRCKETLASLRPPFIGEGKSPTQQEIADNVDHVADGLHDLAGQLQALPVSAADEPHVAAWMADWARYIDVGHRYAAALRTDDQRQQLAVSREGDQAQRAADRFARANGISKCQFHAVPHGGSDPFSGGM